MAEVLGIVASVVGVLDVGARVLLRLRAIRQAWKNVPLEILALSNEIKDLTVVLLHTRDACERVKTAGVDTRFVNGIEKPLRKAQQVMASVEAILDPLASMKEFRKRRQWFKLKSSLEMKRQELKNVRKQIRDLLSAFQISSGSRVELDLKSIQLDLRKNNNTTLERLDSVSDIFTTIDDRLNRISTLVLHSQEAISRLEEVLMRTVDRQVHGYYRDLDDAHSIQELTTARQPRWQRRNIRDVPIYSELGTGTFSIWAIYRNRTCSSFCDCTCHSRSLQPRTLRSPSILNRLLGSLFSTFTGHPWWSEPCNRVTCHRRGSKTLEIAYEFPLWCLNWSLHALLQSGVPGSPAVSLVFRQRVPYQVGTIFHATDTNNIDLLRSILRNNPDSVNHRLYVNGCTALHLACSRAAVISFEIFQLLLRAGADLNVQTDWGQSVATIIASQLVQGVFPEKHILEISKWASLSLFIEELELSPVTEVAIGFRVGDIDDMLRTLPSSKLKLHQFDSTGSNPLHWAARVGNLMVMKSLIQAGLDINCPNILGNSSIMSSFPSHHRLDCFQWLLDNGGDVYQANKDGYNALTFACYHGRIDIVRVLIEHGMHPNTRDGKGRVGLGCSTAYDRVGVLNYLLRLGADPDLVNDFGFAPILDAVRNNAHKCLRALLEKKASHNVSDQAGWTVLHYAAATGDAKTLSILTGHRLKGLDIQQSSWKGSLKGSTAEKIFQIRRSEAPGTLSVAFQKLLTTVQQATDELRLDEEKSWDTFVDAVEYLEK